MRTAIESIKEPAGIFKGANFMTPRIIAYYRVRKRLYAELSEGTGFSQEPIFGVTVHDSYGNDTGKSKMVFSKAEAMEYIESLA